MNYQNDLLLKIKKTICRENLIQKEHKVIVAISGGADSVSLLMALLYLSYDIIAAHCNFKLRGEESDKDELFVEELCKKHKIPLLKKTFNTIDYSKKNRISIEMAARELRYNWFKNLSKDNGAIPVAIAHNSDDNIETMLLNIASGTGIRGLCGMKYKRDGYIIRPLMDCNKDSIINFLKQLNIPFREDSTNKELIYKRNLIRHQLIPLFEKLNPSFRSTTTNRTIKTLKFNHDVFEYTLSSIRKDVIKENRLYINKLLEYNFNRYHLIYELLTKFNFSESVCKSMYNLLETGNKPNKKFFSKSHNIITNSEYWDIIERKEKTHDIIKINISSNGEASLYDKKISWEIESLTESITIKTNSNIATFDYDRLLSENSFLELRNRIAGDYIKPFGMNGKKKTVSRILIDGKYPHKEREQIKILSLKHKPIWIIGIKADSTYAVNNTTTRIIQFTLH